MSKIIKKTEIFQKFTSRQLLSRLSVNTNHKLYCNVYLSGCDVSMYPRGVVPLGAELGARSPGHVRVQR